MSASPRTAIALLTLVSTLAAATTTTAAADSFTPVRLSVDVSPVGAREIPLPVTVTVTADPGVLDTSVTPLRARVKLTQTECGGSFATTSGTVLLDQPLNPQPATGHAYQGTAQGAGRPITYGGHIVCAFIEDAADGRMYANDTGDAPAVDVTPACTAAATRYEAARAALVRARRQLRHARGHAAKARLRTLVARRSATAASDRRAARSACGPALAL